MKVPSITVLLLLTALAGWSYDQQPKSNSPHNQTTQQQRGSKDSPIFVQQLPTPKTADETAQEAQDRASKSANDTNLVNLTGQLVVATYALAAIGILQLFVFGFQAFKLSQTVKSAGEQSEAMERHIGEAARSAKAMENIVSVINYGNHAVMRAYLTVVIGTAVFQERQEDVGDFRFQAKPLVVNAGNTPARKVCIRAAADILPIPIPKDFTFPLPEEGTEDAGTVGSRQSYNISAMVKDLVPWPEVADIKEGTNKALCAWGVVTYEDLFGGKHSTKFGQIMTWLRDGKTPWGYYIPGQNDAD